MEIRQLKYFIEICRTGSFSFAAESLGLTQPALSQQIRLLERGLGAVLFVRSRKGVTLTTSGEVLALRAREILHEVQELERAVVFRGKPRIVSFAVGEALATHFVPKLIFELRQKFPETQFRVVESNLSEIRNALRDGKVDFALTPEAIREKSFKNQYLVEDTILPVVSVDDELAGQSVDWQKLRQREWILFQRGSAIRKLSDAIFAENEKRFEPRVSIELRSLAGVVQCLEAGLGVGFISDLSLTSRLAPLYIPKLKRKRRFFLAQAKHNDSMQNVGEAILHFAAGHGAG